MRSHYEILRTYGIRRLTRELQSRGASIQDTTPQRWADRNSIPSRYWADVCALGVSTLEELAACIPAAPRVNRVRSYPQAQKVLKVVGA